MREEAFRRWMEHEGGRFNADSMDSYCSGCRKVEERGRVDLDEENVRDGLRDVLATLDAAITGNADEWPAPKTVRNYRSHIKAYAELSAALA